MKISNQTSSIEQEGYCNKQEGVSSPRLQEDEAAIP